MFLCFFVESIFLQIDLNLVIKHTTCCFSTRFILQHYSFSKRNLSWKREGIFDLNSRHEIHLCKDYPVRSSFFFGGLEGFWGQPQRPNFPSPWATMLALQQHSPLPRRFYPSYFEWKVHNRFLKIWLCCIIDIYVSKFNLILGWLHALLFLNRVFTKYLCLTGVRFAEIYFQIYLYWNKCYI